MCTQQYNIDVFVPAATVLFEYIHAYCTTNISNMQVY